jgi:hypothetical protein
MSMKIIMTDKSKRDPNTKCPNPKCTGRSAGLSNKQALSCQKCHLAYSLMPSELEPGSTGDGLQDTGKKLDMIPYKRLLLAPAPTPSIIGMDYQIASFKRIHLIMPRVRENALVNIRSMVDNSPVPPRLDQGHMWICCNCGDGWLSVLRDLSCPCCQHSSCSSCKYY